jgi:hypothetical protein
MVMICSKILRVLADFDLFLIYMWNVVKVSQLYLKQVIGHLLFKFSSNFHLQFVVIGPKQLGLI